MTPRPNSGDEFMRGINIGNPLPTSLGIESCKLGQSSRVVSLKPNGLNLSCDEYIKTFNRLMEAKDLMENSSQEGVFDVQQVTNTKALEHVKGSKQGAPIITLENIALGEDPPISKPTKGLK